MATPQRLAIKRAKEIKEINEKIDSILEAQEQILAMLETPAKKTPAKKTTAKK